MSYIGDYAEDYATLNFKFTTVDATGVPVTLTGAPASVAIYVANDLTPVTDGVTLTVDFDGRTGINNVLIDLSASALYVTGKDYQVIITAGTIGGISAVNYVVGSFSIENRYMRGTDGANTVVPDAAGVLPTANEVRDAILDDATRFSGANIDASVSSRSPASEYDTPMSYITEAVATEAKQDAMQLNIDLIEAISKNKLILNVATSEYELYNALGTAIILRWPSLDKTDGVISVDAGVPTQRGVPY